MEVIGQLQAPAGNAQSSSYDNISFSTYEADQTLWLLAHLQRSWKNSPVSFTTYALMETRELPNGFSWNFILESFTKIFGSSQILLITDTLLKTHMRFCMPLEHNH
jgi:hypothetical protein